MHLLAVATGLFLVSVGAAVAQRQDAFVESRSHPAIDYNSAPANTAITELNRTVDEGKATFTFDPMSGYLRSALEALRVPIDSHIVVYTKTSMHADKIVLQKPQPA